MESSRIIAEIDAEIAKLQHIKQLLSGVTGVHTPALVTASASKPGRGRPKGSKNAVHAPAPEVSPAVTARKRKLSPEGRKRIAEAMKKRWAERRKTT